MNALVSVITRTLGRPCLADAAHAVAEQTWRPLEWVVVDAAGSGLVPPAAGDVPVRVVSTGERMPRSVAANAGLRAALGDWILFLDDDDLIRPGHIARLVTALEASPGHLLAYADAEMWTAENVRGHVFDVPYSPLLLAMDNLFPPMAALVSAQLVREHGCKVDETLDFFEDWDFWRQVAAHTDFLRVPGISAVYRTHLSESGVTGRGPHAGDMRQQRDREAILARFAAQRGALEQRHDALKSDARDAFAAGDRNRALGLWREAVRLHPYDVDSVLREAETACLTGAWDDGRRTIVDALERLPGEERLVRNLAIVERAIADAKRW